MLISRAFLAGLVAAEGCFQIVPTNAGQSWRCGFSLVLRDDDTPLLQSVAAYARCGRLYAKPARSTSRPQVGWQVASMRDCQRLCQLLDEPLWISKKADEFAIWRHAVAIWASRRGERWHEMQQLSAELIEARDPARSSSRPVDISHPAFEGFLAGFVTGEAHFGVTRGCSPTFTINLRSDDKRTLDVLALGTGVGYVARVPAPDDGTNPRASWRVHRRDEQHELVNCFEKNRPLGRKGTSYELWRDLVLLRERPTHKRWTGVAKQRRDELSGRLRASTEYHPGAWSPSRPPRSEPTKERVLAALRRWADQSERPYSASSYAAFRRAHDPSAPTRNTAARAFGSWRNALVAAGLTTSDAMPPERIAQIVGTASPAREAKRAQGRGQIIDAIRACTEELGRPPRAMEFFRWRLERAPESPTQAELYRLFEGGFPAALDAARRAPPG